MASRRAARCIRYAIDLAATGKVAATCPCGWSSPPVLTSGMAGTLWDEHVAASIDAGAT